MYKEYKTVRIARDCKYWLNSLITLKESELKKCKTDLIADHERILKEHSDFSDGFSPTISIGVTSGSILEAAYRYVRDEKIDLKEIRKQIDHLKHNYSAPSKLNVGTLTPRFYLDSEILDQLEKYQGSLKSDEMQRPLMLNYIIKLVIFAFYEKNELEIKKLDQENA